MELRFDLVGRCAVRVSGGPVAARHAESVPPVAPWCLSARCGRATGWLLAESEPDEAALARLELEVARRTALELQRRASSLAALGAAAVERFTHRLRADVAALQSVAGLAVDSEEVREAVESTGREAQQRLTAARELMGVLDPEARLEPEPVASVLRDALRPGASVVEPEGECAQAFIPGPGWEACARLLASTPARAYVIEPDPAGWRVSADADLRLAGLLVVAAGGLLTDDGALLIPAAPSTG
jgi:hypothetical protein